MSLDGNLGIDLTARDLTGPAFASVQQNLKKIQDQNDAVASSMGKLTSATSAFGGILGGLGLEKIAEQFSQFNDRVISQTASYANLSSRLQLTTSQYQALRLAGIDVGVSQDQLQTSLVKFNSTIGSAEQGNRQAIDAFNQLGIKILDTSGKVRDMPTLLREAASALLQMQDGSLKARLETELFGRSGADLNPMLRQLATGVDALQAKFAQGIVSQDVIDKLHQLEIQSESSRAKIDAFYARVAGPIYVGAIATVSSALADLSVKIDKARFSWSDLLAVLANPTTGPAYLYNRLGQGGDPSKQIDDQIAKKQAELDSIQKNIDAHPGARVSGSTAKRQGALQAEVDQLNAQKQVLDLQRQVQIQGDEQSARADRSLLPGETATGGGDHNPDAKGGGGTKSDKIGAAIARLQGEKDAADKALATLMASASMPLDLLNKQVDLQKKTDDEIAKLGSYNKNDPRIAQLKAEVIARQESEAALKREQDAITEADNVMRKYGDGQIALTETHRKLNDALATGRLNYGAYTAAVRDADYAAKQQALTMQGQQGGLVGLAAGFQAAALAYEKQNTAFAAGGQVFQSTAQLMSQAFTNWRKTGQLDIAAFLSSWADMLQQMIIKAAANQAFSALMGSLGNSGLGGFLGSLFGAGQSGGFTLASAPAGGYGGFSGYASTLPGFADGGAPPVGVPSMVGEQGPELFVPKQAGTIVPNGELGSKGGSQIVINHTVNISTGVQQTVRAEILTLMPHLTSTFVDAVQSARMRGGRFTAAFRT